MPLRASQRCYRIVTGTLLVRYVRFLDWGLGSYTEARSARAPAGAGSEDLVKNSPSRRPVLALLAAELVCVGAWTLTGSIWWFLGAVVAGLALIVVALFPVG